MGVQERKQLLLSQEKEIDLERREARVWPRKEGLPLVGSQSVICSVFYLSSYGVSSCILTFLAISFLSCPWWWYPYIVHSASCTHGFGNWDQLSDVLTDSIKSSKFCVSLILRNSLLYWSNSATPNWMRMEKLLCHIRNAFDWIRSLVLLQGMNQQKNHHLNLWFHYLLESQWLL